MNNKLNNKVVLAIPNVTWINKRDFKMLSPAIPVLSALLKDEFDFTIIDANIDDLSKEHFINELIKINPSIVLLSSPALEMNQLFIAATSIIKTANPNIITIMGGPHPTSLPEVIIQEDPNLDLIFMGHAEERIIDFLKIVRGQDFTELRKYDGICYINDSKEIVLNSVTSYIGDVRQMVKPDYTKIDVTKYFDHDNKNFNMNSKVPAATIMTSYGCPHNCIFCATKTISGKKAVYRSVEDILEEIEYLKECGAKHLIFIDDNLTAKKDRLVNLLNEFISRKYNLTWMMSSLAVWHLNDEILELMKKSGCTRLSISCESGCQRVLSKIIRKPLKLDIIPPILKKCKELGIEIVSNYVIGFPGETWDDLRQTFKHAEECDFDVVHFHIATPLPKTRLYDIAVQENLLPPNFSFTDPDFSGWCQGFLSTEHFTPRELMILRAYEWDRINFSTPEKIKKAAKIYSLSIEELNEFRKQTIKKLGLYYN